MIQKKKIDEFKEFKELEDIIRENEVTTESFRTMSKREDYNRSLKYSNSYNKLKQLKQRNPTKYKEYEQYKQKLSEKREKESQKSLEIAKALYQQELAKKKNAVLREVGLVHYGLNYDDYEKEQKQNEKNGKEWLAIFEWVESKGHNLCIDKNGHDICRK
ncbi:MAG: hypothetical protein WC934_04895 [Acidithiobacillus sp.]|jgi:hypothetical protein|uniref:hypothetical protein n=1 Tax=Acidithiobacillus sp. TaxID=1872118 RepID=UPI00355DA793